ncbi:uncharacterized protein TNCT_635981 [Trichonephila clavata]|uniref:Uncharacterized protein n=1 Tax=Trichonephila clavata TaxID=2740835 RepID=A0A8X6KBE3_TRICU|nr:uncharacterized protein TNCT_635981 [Trichonephila clavata]
MEGLFSVCIYISDIFVSVDHPKWRNSCLVSLQNIILDEEANGPEGREIGYQIGRHLYLNPAVVELPPDGTLQTHDLALIREIAEAKVQSYLYSKTPRRSNCSRSSKHHPRSRRIRRNVIRRTEMQSETEDTVYYISDAETSPSPGDSFEFSEAECDMHLRMAMEERPV